MTSKYRSWVCVLVAVLAACAPQSAVPSGTAATSASASPTERVGIPATLLPAEVRSLRRWNAIPEPVQIVADFAADARAGAPRLRLDSGPPAPMTFSAGGRGFAEVGTISTSGVPPGEHRADVLVTLLDGTTAVAGSTAFLVTQPEYVAWTLDFEGDASGDTELANTAAIADGLKIAMSVLWNPRVWTTSQVSAERQDAMLAWTKGRMAKGDEVGLHLHMWTDYVRAVGLVPRTAPSWAGRGDGYDVPITAYPENEQQAMIGYGVKLMTQHGLPTPTSFRAGGDFGDAATLRAVAASGFTADCTAVAKDYPPIGRIPYPWTLPAGAQPYHPSSTDANATGDLALLEAPTIGGNTFGFTTQTIQPQIRANLGLLAPAGTVAAERRAITIVSHPGTIVPAERAAIEALLGAFDAVRYDRDSGPVRFVTLAQLAKVYAR
jgi:hypothetical protein